MVMPCSRSASSPSVSNDKSRASWPRLLEARATAASWSSNIARVSCSSRPISVLLPSSTLPAVMKRNTPRSSTAGAVRSISPSKVISEVSFLLAPFHGGFRGLVVHARGPALGDRSQSRLCEDLGARLCLVAPRSADRGIERKLGDRFEQGHRLRGIPAFVEAAQFDRAAADRILDGAHDKPLAELGSAGVAECDHLREIMPGVN